MFELFNVKNSRFVDWVIVIWLVVICVKLEIICGHLAAILKAIR